MSEAGRDHNCIKKCQKKNQKDQHISRETIRRRLAKIDDTENDTDSSDDANDDSLSSNNLLVCFLNETTSDLEEDVEENINTAQQAANRGAKILSQALSSNDWDSDDSDTSVEDTEDDLAEKLPPIKNGLVRGNISRKKEHVIIPLRCSTEAGKETYSIPTPPDENDDNQHLVPPCLETAFFQQLSNIQVYYK